MSEKTFLMTRAVLAITLMIGFYLLAIGIALGLFYIPYAEVVYGHRLHIKLLLFCVLAGGTVLWAIMPRSDSFTPPGPQLTHEENPRLFDMIEEVARVTHQEPPAEVYLVHDVNAFVTQRGGVMGVGSKRVMGLGLPLMQVLTVEQLRAVIAHEFGHFHGGDVKIGPWIYQTRAAIGRAIHALGSAGHNWIQQPFIWYANLFLRITHAISRKQEYSADALAAGVAGAENLEEGLRRITAASATFGVFVSSRLEPVLGAGFRAPILQGYSRFVESPRGMEVRELALKKRLESEESDPFDTHPSLPERLRALELLPRRGQVGDEVPSVDLLNDVAGLERQLLKVLMGEEKVRHLNVTTWEEVGAKVFAPAWVKSVEKFRQHLVDITPLTLPTSVDDQRKLGERLLGKDASRVPPETQVAIAQNVLGSSLALALVMQGFVPDASPEVTICLRRGEESIEPFRVLSALASGEVSVEEWRSQCERVGIGNQILAKVHLDG